MILIHGYDAGLPRYEKELVSLCLLLQSLHLPFCMAATRASMWSPYSPVEISSTEKLEDNEDGCSLARFVWSKTHSLLQNRYHTHLLQMKSLKSTVVIFKGRN
jgi:hypothetical protein